MVCRTVMQYLVAGSGPPGHEIWPEMEMWVGDTPSAGDISWGHQQITKQDHFLLVSPCAHHTVARRRPAAAATRKHGIWSKCRGQAFTNTPTHVRTRDLSWQSKNTTSVSTAANFHCQWSVSPIQYALFNKCVGSHANCSMFHATLGGRHYSIQF